MKPKKKNLTKDQKAEIVIKQINQLSNTDKPYRISLLETDIPIKFKASALKKINTLSYMDRCSGEYYKLKQWVDIFMQIPFCKYKTLWSRRCFISQCICFIYCINFLSY